MLLIRSSETEQESVDHSFSSSTGWSKLYEKVQSSLMMININISTLIYLENVSLFMLTWIMNISLFQRQTQ